MVAARPNQKRLVYSVELSTPLFWRVEIHSRMTKNFAPSQYPTKPDTINPENAYAHLQPALTIADRANVTTRTAGIHWTTHELRERAGMIRMRLRPRDTGTWLETRWIRRQEHRCLNVLENYRQPIFAGSCFSHGTFHGSSLWYLISTVHTLLRLSFESLTLKSGVDQCLAEYLLWQ